MTGVQVSALNMLTDAIKTFLMANGGMQKLWLKTGGAAGSGFHAGAKASIPNYFERLGYLATHFVDIEQGAR